MIRMVNTKHGKIETELVSYELEGYEGTRYFISRESYDVRQMEENLIFNLGIHETIVRQYKELVLDENRADRKYDGCGGNCSCGGEQ